MIIKITYDTNLPFTWNFLMCVLARAPDTGVAVTGLLAMLSIDCQEVLGTGLLARLGVLLWLRVLHVPVGVCCPFSALIH